MDCALDLMRRLPPQQIEKNLSDLIDLVPSLCEDLLSSVDQPLKIAKDKESGKDYLLCDYNRDGDSYRFDQNVDTWFVQRVKEMKRVCTNAMCFTGLLGATPTIRR